MSTNELARAMELMGLNAISTAKLNSMIAEVDDNHNGELDYDEFLKVLEKTKSADSDLASIFSRKQNSGPPLTWSKQKLGKGLRISDDGMCLTRAAAGDGHAVAMLSEFHSIAADEYDKASVIINFSGLAPESFVGVIGRNFLSAGSFDAPLGPDKNSSVVQCSTGNLYHKSAVPQGLSLGTLPADVKLHFEADARDQKMTMEVIGKNGEVARTLLLEWLPPAFAIVVGLAPEADQKVSIVGSSTEKTSSRATRKNSIDLWDDENVVSLNTAKSNDLGDAIAQMATSM